jgi:putative flippase GtrA
MARARLFTLAFGVVVLLGLVVSVAIPLVLPGPKLFTITLGSACFIVLLVLGGRLLRRVIVQRPPGGPPAP